MLVYHELATVPKKGILDPTALSKRMLTTPLHFKCKSLVHAGQRNVIIHMNAFHRNIMKLKFVIGVSKSSD